MLLEDAGLGKVGAARPAVRPASALEQRARPARGGERGARSAP